MDMGLSQDLSESFRIFQSRILTEYDKIVAEYDLTVMDATKDIETQQSEMRQVVAKALENYKTEAGHAWQGGHRYFGDGLTYLNPNDLKGKLIAIEGTDGVGRSTHIELLQEWLEVQGYGVVTTGWTRSNLMSKTIEMRQAGQHSWIAWSFSLAVRDGFCRPSGASNHSRPPLRVHRAGGPICLYGVCAGLCSQRRPEMDP